MREHIRLAFLHPDLKVDAQGMSVLAQRDEHNGEGNGHSEEEKEYENAWIHRRAVGLHEPRAVLHDPRPARNSGPGGGANVGSRCGARNGPGLFEQLQCSVPLLREKWQSLLLFALPVVLMAVSLLLAKCA
jgi:hypothetical protein